MIWDAKLLEKFNAPKIGEYVGTIYPWVHPDA